MQFSALRRPALVAVIPALVAACLFTPSSGVLSSFVWMITYVPNRLLLYWPHEMGHYIVGWLGIGRIPMVLAGSGVEIGLPLGLFLTLIWKKEYLLAVLCMFWCGYAMQDTAYYMADAANPKFLVGGGPFDAAVRAAGSAGHDWIFLFGRVGLIKSAVPIARILYSIGAWFLFFPVAQLFFGESTAREQE